MLRRKKKGLAQSFLLVFLLATAIFVIFKSPFFDVKKIEVHGNHRLGKEKIISVSGIYTGVNIFKINLGDAAANLDALPVLKEVELRRNFPSQVVIDVRERNPVALLPAGDGFVYVDDEQVYVQKDKHVFEGLPVLTGIKTTFPSPGEKIEAKGLQALLTVIEELPGELTKCLSEIHLGENGAVVLYTIEGNQCRLGNPLQVQTKGEVFLELLRELEQNNKQIEYVDLSFVGSPVVKYN